MTKIGKLIYRNVSKKKLQRKEKNEIQKNCDLAKLLSIIYFEYMLFTVFFTIIFIGYLNLFFLVLTAESEL